VGDVPAGVREKLDRAHLHRQDFERREQRFVHSKAYTVAREDDVQAGKRRWILHIRERPPVTEWGGIVGDCLFNFRSALDHLAFGLATAYAASQGRPLTTLEQERSAFPIFHDRAPTKKNLDKRIGAVDPQARRLIEAMQPYGRTDRAALKYLDLLHNFDKHRTLHVFVAASTGLACTERLTSTSSTSTRRSKTATYSPRPRSPRTRNAKAIPASCSA
jgi:hypothetical protein